MTRHLQHQLELEEVTGGLYGGWFGFCSCANWSAGPDSESEVREAFQGHLDVVEQGELPLPDELASAEREERFARDTCALCGHGDHQRDTCLNVVLPGEWHPRGRRQS